MEYIIIILILLCNAILRDAVQFNKKRMVDSIYWYLQPFIFPMLMLFGLILKYINLIDIVSFIVFIGLLFELISFIFKKWKKA